MPFKIYSIDDLPGNEWSILTKNSVYSSPEFARVWRTMNGKEIFFTEENNGKLSAGMAGVIFGRYFLKRFQSMPDGLNGGAFFAEDCSIEEERRFMRSVCDWLRLNRFIRADIHNPASEINIKDYKKEDMITHIIRLDGESILPPGSNVKKHIRTGKRRGAMIAIIDNNKYLDNFYKLVKKTSKRHKEKPRFSKEFFAELLKLSANNDNILWLAIFSGDIMIGSRICFIEQSQLLAWQYYSDKEYSHLKPGYLLLDYIINFAIKRGIRTINLGWSPFGAMSLIDFKKRWGGREKTFPCYTYFSPLGKLVYVWR